MLLTVLTPTYNRGDYLEKLYISLKKQSFKDFMWLVVDDGSTDNTKEVIDAFQKEGIIRIEYLHKDNGGKHTALNVGIKYISTELTFIVDSDDTLTDDAFETIHRYHEKYKDATGICGYSFFREFPDGKINGKPFRQDEWVVSYIQARINSDDTNSDKAEVFFTSVLKQYPFPEYPGEKFLGEDIVWIRMAKKYKMVHINQAIYIGQYLDEGLTSNRRSHNIKAPIGCMNRAKEFLTSEIKLKYRIKGAMQYIIYGTFAGYKIGTLISDAPDKVLVVLLLIPSIVIYEKWRSQYKER